MSVCVRVHTKLVSASSGCERELTSNGHSAVAVPRLLTHFSIQMIIATCLVDCSCLWGEGYRSSPTTVVWSVLGH